MTVNDVWRKIMAQCRVDFPPPDPWRVAWEQRIMRTFVEGK